jgi:hypothetical protein
MLQEQDFLCPPARLLTQLASAPKLSTFLQDKSVTSQKTLIPLYAALVSSGEPKGY